MEDTVRIDTMNKQIELDNFTGPLDLLLQLIEEKEMEITQVSLAAVTEQFLAYLDEVEERAPYELADFLAVATKLLLIKSQALLPFLQQEEESDPNELAAQLKMYKKYAQATEAIEAMLEQKRFLFGKPFSATQKQRAVVFQPPKDITPDAVYNYFVEVLERLAPVVRIPKAAMQKIVSLREKLDQIRVAIEDRAQLHFYQLLADSKDRGEVVVTFLALLELVKQQTIAVRQDTAFNNITIEKIS